MTYRRLCLWGLVAMLLLGAPGLLRAADGNDEASAGIKTALLQEACPREAATGENASLGSNGAITNLNEGVCYWTCYGGGQSGATPVAWPWARNCRNLCAGMCGGPCDILY